MSTTDVVSTIVTVISPFIGAACGVYVVPIIERMKNKSAISQLLSNYKEELKDIEMQTKNLSVDLYASHLTLEKYKSGESNYAMFYGLNANSTSKCDTRLCRLTVLFEYLDRPGRDRECFLTM
ncbi:hypothetical protein [Aeromonas veronii]|uniref:hypothetical protein n=1 Tax=Aeromonas veronii TaxID=654 RepID=UPI002443BA2D|nr:hypothetical protein [Aeromonas veronii]